MLPFLRLRFLHFNREKTLKLGILEILLSWYMLSLKPKGKVIAKMLSILFQFHVSLYF